jgi:uncharacterized protein YjbI with pentapeptide repeats
MANEEHVAQLGKGPAMWNAWRNENPDIRPNLSGADLRQEGLGGAHLGGADLCGANLSRASLWRADLSGADLSGADLSVADLRGANLSGARLSRAHLGGANFSGANLSKASLWRAEGLSVNLSEANLSEAQLTEADLYSADLSEANLSEANLSEANLARADLSMAGLGRANLGGANLWRANLSEAHLNEANLRRADLDSAQLVETDFTGADLTGCRIYGVSAWNLKLEGAKQQNLRITGLNEPEITVDNIEVAQFIYLMLHNEKIRDVIDTIGKKAVLILGRFTAERKAVLDALRDELRKRNLLPILFDFAIPASRDVTETVKTLAGLARFVIADATDATEVRVELHNIVRDFPSLPIQPILLRGHPEFVSLSHLMNFPWVLPIFEYGDLEDLLASLDKIIIAPEVKVKALKEALEEGRRKIEAELIKPQ